MKAHFKKNWFWYLVILLLAGGNIYFYFATKWTEHQTKIKLEEAEIECNDRIATITEQNHLEEIKRQGSFYVSLVNTSIEEENWEKTREILENIVKETLITRIDFVLPDQQIKASTNRKAEGGDVGKDLPANLFTVDAATHVQKTDQGYLLSIPVYDKNVYSGRLLMEHSLLTSNIAPR